VMLPGGEYGLQVGTAVWGNQPSGMDRGARTQVAPGKMWHTVQPKVAMQNQSCCHTLPWAHPPLGLSFGIRDTQRWGIQSCPALAPP
jgi:hypothetical protein